jgi:hypothetical protein
MGVPTKIWFFLAGFEVNYPTIFEGSDHHGAFMALGLGFRVTCVFPPKFGCFFGVLR